MPEGVVRVPPGIGFQNGYLLFVALLLVLMVIIDSVIGLLTGYFFIF